MAERNFEYDVALSFAGEQRPYVLQVAQGLRTHGVRVFYDDYEKDNLWGKDLYAHLTEVYQHKCRYCVVFVSKEYAAEVWPTAEFKSAQARAIKEKGEYIRPARFDNTSLPGLLHTVGYIDLKTTSPEELKELVIKKLGKKVRSNYLPPDLDRLYSRLNIADNDDAQSFAHRRASSFFQALCRMTPDERETATSFIQYACYDNLPDNLHIDADLLSRVTGKSITRLRALLGDIQSLGFSCSLHEGSHDDEDLPGEHLGQRYMFHLRWIDLSTHEECTDEEIGYYNEMLPELIVITEMIYGATEDYCEEHGKPFLDRLDFSQLAKATTSQESH